MVVHSIADFNGEGQPTLSNQDKKKHTHTHTQHFLWQEAQNSSFVAFSLLETRVFCLKGSMSTAFGNLTIPSLALKNNCYYHQCSDNHYRFQILIGANVLWKNISVVPKNFPIAYLTPEEPENSCKRENQCN
jgi:hypothetical protein